MFYNEDFHENILSIIDNIFQFVNKVRPFQSTTWWKLLQQFAPCSGLKSPGKFWIKRVNYASTPRILVNYNLTLYSECFDHLKNTSACCPSFVYVSGL